MLRQTVLAGVFIGQAAFVAVGVTGVVIVIRLLEGAVRLLSPPPAPAVALRVVV